MLAKGVGMARVPAALIGGLVAALLVVLLSIAAHHWAAGTPTWGIAMSIVAGLVSARHLRKRTSRRAGLSHQ